MNPPTTLTNHNPPATIGCGLNPNPIRREESDTPHVRYSVESDATSPNSTGWARRCSMSLHASPPPASINNTCTNTLPRS